MKGFQITISSQQLLGAVTKVHVLKGEYILLEATNRFEAKKSSMGLPYFRMAMRFSMAGTNGASFVEVDCNYMPYDATVENEGTSEEKISLSYLDVPCVETSRVVFDPKQIVKLAKIYGDNEEILCLNCFVERKLCTVQNRAMKGKAQTITTDITLPMIEKDINNVLSGKKNFAEAKVASNALKKICSESISNTGAEEVYFGFGKKLEAYIVDQKLLYNGVLSTVEYTNHTTKAAFYPIKGTDFQEIVSTFKPDENVRMSLKGENTPRYFEFCSVDSGATYVLPLYGEPIDYKRHEATFSVLKLANRKVSVSFDRKDFIKAISLLQIGYTADNLRFILTDGDCIVIQQAKGDKNNSISIKGTVKISGRANFGEHFDPDEGPVYVEFFADTFSRILKGLEYKSEGSEKNVETVRLTIFDCCTKFENVEPEETKFIVNYMSQEQHDEFEKASKVLLEKAREKASATVPVAETDTVAQTGSIPPTDADPNGVDSDLEKKLT